MGLKLTENQILSDGRESMAVTEFRTRTGNDVCPALIQYEREARNSPISLNKVVV